MRRRNRRAIIHSIPYFISCRVLQGQRPPPLEVAAPVVLEAMGQIGERWQAKLHAYVVMPDHWHALISTTPPHHISRVMASIKTSSALLLRHPAGGDKHLWQPGFFDHVCRNDEDLSNSLRYIHFNPVKKGLVGLPEQWPWSSWYGYFEGGEPPVPIAPVSGAFDVRWAEWGWHPGPRRRPRRRGGEESR
jgi:putative transposase